MEPLFFIFFVYGFLTLAFARIGLRRLRRWRLDREMRKHAWKLIGAPAEDAQVLFGEPVESFEGGERRLYEWRSPWHGGLLVRQVLTEDGRIVDLHWHVRESDR